MQILIVLACLVAAARLTAVEIIDDRVIESKLTEEGRKYIDAGAGLRRDQLADQLKRRECTVRLPRPARHPLTPSELYDQCRASVVIVGGIHKHSPSNKWESIVSTAFAVAEPDIFATNCHVIDNTNAQILVVMTHDQQVLPVTEILACSPTNDCALIRVAGLRLRPLPLRANAPVGTAVNVIGHPERRFYTLTRGLVSRYYKPRAGGNEPGSLWMQITAEFAKGASGAPVLDDTGNATGIAARRTTFFNATKDHRDVEIIFQLCVPARNVLDLINP